MFSCFFSENLKFWTPPQGGGGGLGEASLGTWEYCILDTKIKYFHRFFNVLQNRACVCAMKKSPKGDFLHYNHHDDVI